jgi:repressor LexA
MKELTARQTEILNLIRQHIEETGFPPTRMDICNALGFKSPNAAEEHLKALAKKGVIALTSGASRGIRLTDTLVAAANTLMQIPLVGRVAAGQPILAQEHVEASYAIDPALFAYPPDYFLKVRGMSMRDAGIWDGDLLAVKQLAGGASEARNGQIVVARIQDEVTVKRFQRQGQAIHLIAENPDFKPIVIQPNDPEIGVDFSIEGLGVGVIRNPKTLS